MRSALSTDDDATCVITRCIVPRMSTKEEVAARLRDARARKYETAEDAAAALGLRPSTYHGHENGSRGFVRASAIKYARVFGVHLNWLLTGDGPRDRSAKLRDDVDELPEPFRQQAIEFIEFLKEKANHR
jgi:phage repressor protein C with HTH and peptisase S24 domain